MEVWIREADLDGFNLSPVVQPESWEDIVGLLVLEPQRRAYTGTTAKSLEVHSARMCTAHARAIYKMTILGVAISMIIGKIYANRMIKELREITTRKGKKSRNNDSGLWSFHYYCCVR